MIKHIFKILWNERKHNIVILLELTVISLILWSVVDQMYCRTRNYLSPTGFDIENTFLVQLKELPLVSPNYQEDFDADKKVEAVKEIYGRIQNFPGVEAVSISLASRPGSPGNITPSAHSNRFEETVKYLLKYVSPSFLNVYRYEPISMTRDEMVKALEEDNILVSTEFEELAKKNNNTILGDTLYFDSKREYRIGVVKGLIKPVRYSKYQTAWMGVLVKKVPDGDLGGYLQSWLSGLEFSIRVRPEAMEGFAERFEKEMAPKMEIGNFRFQHILYNPDQFEWEAKNMKNQFLSEGILLIFLVANILLGVAGVFWYRTVYRRSQIGLRISFGASPRGAQGVFLLEGVLMQTIALLVAALLMIIAFVQEIPSVEIIPLDVQRYFGGLLITAIIMYLGVLLAVWMPTRKAKRIPPAQALREE